LAKTTRALAMRVCSPISDPTKVMVPVALASNAVALMVTFSPTLTERQVFGRYVDFSPNLPQVGHGEHGSIFLDGFAEAEMLFNHQAIERAHAIQSG
jgi:hypothetical protein